MLNANMYQVGIHQKSGRGLSKTEEERENEKEGRRPRGKGKGKVKSIGRDARYLSSRTKRVIGGSH